MQGGEDVNSAYRKETTEGSSRFIVTPASVNKVKGSEPWIMAGLFALIVIGTTPAQTGMVGWMIRWAMAVGVGWLGYRGTIMLIMRKGSLARSAGGDFIASRMGILTSSKQPIVREDIEELQIRNTFSKAKDVSWAPGVLDKKKQFTILGGGMEYDTAGNLMNDAMGAIGGMKEIT